MRVDLDEAEVKLLMQLLDQVQISGREVRTRIAVLEAKLDGAAVTPQANGKRESLEKVK